MASLRRDRSQVSAELATASSARAQQFNEWALNHLAVDAAQTEVNRTLMLAEQARRDVLAAERRVRAYATDAFMNPPALASMSVLSIADADQMSWAHDVLSLTADDQSRVVDELAAAEVFAQRRSAEADKAATAARERETREKDELDQLEAAEARQAALVAEVDGRLDHALGEVAALDAVDRQAAKELEDAGTWTRRGGQGSSGRKCPWSGGSGRSAGNQSCVHPYAHHRQAAHRCHEAVRSAASAALGHRHVERRHQGRQLLGEPEHRQPGSLAPRTRPVRPDSV